MSSNLYARYIPPPKTNVPADPLTRSSHLNAAAGEPLLQPPTTQTDASATYTRFVPPPSKSRSAVERFTVVGPASPPKRKHEEGAYNATSKPKRTKSDSAPGKDDADNEGRSKLKKKEKKTKRKESGNETDNGAVEETCEDQDSKHISLLLKRDKSISKAEKVAKVLVGRATELNGAEEQELEKSLELHPLEPLPQPEPAPEFTGQPKFSTLPPWLASPTRVSPTTTASFEDFGLPLAAIKVLQTKGFAHAFAVQAAVLPLLVPKQRVNVEKHGDVVVSAATGSGKTLSYVLPMVGDISDTTVTRLRGLIIMPTRELVTQARTICESCAIAFSAANKRHIKIGIAVGNQTLKSEQASLMKEELRYDPIEYQKQEQRLNLRWESSTQDTDDEINTYDEELLSKLPEHILRYTPKVDILICTPGRLVEHLKSTPGFTLDYIKWLVIDEADRLLDQSFQQWLPNVMSKFTKGRGTRNNANHRVKKVVLSATVTRDIGQLNELKLYRPTLVVLGDSDSLKHTMTDQKSDEAFNLPATLHEYAIRVDTDGNKPLYLMQAIKNKSSLYEKKSEEFKSATEDSVNGTSSNRSRSVSPASFSSETDMNKILPQLKTPTVLSSPEHPRGFLVFTKSNETAVRLGRLISILEPTYATKIGILTSTIPHSTRKATLSSFHAGRISMLFASDLVARGLDLPNLAYVINYDIPTSLTSYIHRVGRTARAGKEGHALTLLTKAEARWFWTDIARSSKVRRTAGKVSRVNIETSVLGDTELIKRYEEALTTLGEEAGAR